MADPHPAGQRGAPRSSSAVAPAREAAFRALRAIATQPIDLGEALRRSRDRLTDPRDRALATELVTGTLRWRAALDYQLERVTSKPLARLDGAVLDALRLGAYQLLHLERVPVSAAVNDSVALVKRSGIASAASFVNAVLRRLAREQSTLAWPEPPAAAATDVERGQLAAAWAVRHAHPQWLVDRWLARYGRADTETWLQFNNRPAPLTLAANRLHGDRDALRAALGSEGFAAEPTVSAPHGLIAADARVLSSPAFARGDFVVQDEASQIIPELARPAAAARVLDACASPGGKTLALAAQVGPDGRVIATDVRPRRVRLLAETVHRLGLARVQIVHIADHGGLPFADGAFDVILVDAPCSGLGTLRRDPDIKWRRVEADLPELARRQIELLARVSPHLGRGGRLVYSTCSSEPEENDEVVAAFLAAHPAFSIVPLQSIGGLPAPIAALATAEGYLRTSPLDGLEAFFGAVLERRLSTAL